MTISVVQTATSASNPPFNFGTGVTAGNTVIVVIDAYNTNGTNQSVGTVKLGGSTQPGTVAFFNSGTTNGVNSASLGGNVAYTSIWMIPNIPGGATSIDFTGGNGVGQVAWEVSGLGSSPSLDKSNSGSSTSATTADSGSSGAITSAPEFIVGAAMIFSGSGASSPSGWTVSNPSGDVWAGYQIATSSGGSYDWSQTSAGTPWAAAIVTISTSAAAAPNGTVQPLTTAAVAARRRLARAVTGFIPVTTVNTRPAGTVQPLTTIQVPRRRPARIVTGFIPVTTVNTRPAGTVQPITARPAPRRRPARATVQFTPVRTTNPAFVAVPQPPPKGGGMSWFKRSLLWADL